MQKFAKEMESRYRNQFSLSSFRKIVESIPMGQVIGVWDAHEFAWNYCHGTDPSNEMEDKKKIATAYFHHYFSELNKWLLADTPPALPIADLKNQPDGTPSIHRALDFLNIRVLLCDVRSWRSEHPTDGSKRDLLGPEQDAWLFNEFDNHPGAFMLASCSTMTASSDLAWDCFGEFFHEYFLQALQSKVVLFFAGDIHEDPLPPPNGSDPIEIVSSESGLSFPISKRNFGLIEIDGNSAYMYKRGRVQCTGQLNLGTGSFATTMSAFVNESDTPLEHEEATEQKSSAMRSLKSMQQHRIHDNSVVPFY